MWLIPLATAAGLPWECPAVATPADAKVYVDDGGLPDLWDALHDEAATWVADDCAWTEETLDDGTTVRACTSADGASLVETEREERWSEDFSGSSSSDWTLDARAPDGAWISLTRTHGGSWGGNTAWYASTTLGAAWSGAPAGAPADAWFSVETWSASATDGASGVVAATPVCAWSWSRDDSTVSYRLEAGGHDVTAMFYLLQCGGHPDAAWMDGEFFGAIDGDTWDLAEDDRDGWSVDDGDCDDADPTVYPCAPETAHDGIDQDCDGADVLDADGDGRDASFAGGDDCDDDDPYVHPAGRETAGDGVDQDCDGHDDVDADGDGYTADGDARPVDCDDDDASVSPGAPERANDGIDQDCDGEDVAQDGPTGGESDPAAPIATRTTGGEQTGCALPFLAAALVVPLGGLLRRR